MNTNKNRALLVIQLDEYLTVLEYVEPDIKELFFDVLRYVPELKKIIKSVKIYRQEHIVSP